MSDSPSTPDLERDQCLARDLTSAASALQRAIHSAVEAGLKVTVKVESMHHVGHHHPEPLVEIMAERVIKLA
jgi:hypothetical protein